MRLSKLSSMILVVALVCCAVVAQATVTIDLVPVGNADNVGEVSGIGDLPHPSRICGAVGYNYNIGKYEVTAGQYMAFLNAVAKIDTYGLYNEYMAIHSFGCKITQHGASGSYTYDFSGRPSGTESDWANRPVNFVSWGDSARFANWLHNGQPTGVQSLITTEDGAYYLNGAMTDTELCAVSRKADWKWAVTSEDEWYKAAYYKGGSTSAGYWDYPTGVDIPTTPGRDMADVTNAGNNANYYNNGYVLGSPYYRTEVGEFQLSDSAYGTFDQAGNVSEWTEARLYDSSRGYRGGSFSSTTMHLPASDRIGTYPTGEYSDLGFRVANVPEPSTLILLAAGAIGFLGWAWRRRCVTL